MKESMYALVKTKAGPGAEYKRVQIPEIRPNEVLIKIEAAGLCAVDVHIYNWTPFAAERIKLPLIFGHEYFGEVIKVGDQVKSLKKGDKVAGETHLPCGKCFQCRTGMRHICQHWTCPGFHSDGAFAEFLAVPEILGVKLPNGTSPEVGAVYEPFGVAVHAVLAGEVCGSTVAVFGCGPIGLCAIATAKAGGASKIFGVEPSSYRLKLATKMGATLVLDPQRDSVVETIREETNGVGVDVVIELSGSAKAAEQGFKALRNGGRVSMVGSQMKPIALDWSSDVIYKEAKILGITGREMFKTWYQARSLIESNQVDLQPIITHRLALAEFTSAFEVASSRECGKVLLIPKSQN